MLWLMVLVIVGGLAFVMFRKPHLNSMGVGWIPPEQRVVRAPASRQLPPSTDDAADQG